MKQYIALLAIGAAALCCLQGPALAQDAAKTTPVPAEKAQVAAPKMSARLKEVDTDGDGNISKAEYLAQAEKRFAKMDLNGDGKITAEERAAKRKEMQARRDQARAERAAKRAEQGNDPAAATKSGGADAPAGQ